MHFTTAILATIITSKG